MNKQIKQKIKTTKKQFKLSLELKNGTQKYIKVNENIRTDLLENISTHSFIKNEGDFLVIKNNFFDESKKVKNVYRYYLKKDNSLYICYDFAEKMPGCNSEFNDCSLDLEKNLPTILIVLESPHQYEYNYTDSNLEPIAPAQKSTGKQLDSNLAKIIEEISTELTELEYRVLIVNPIPFQTSLHFLHKKPIKSLYKTLRDKVWITLWNNDSYKNDFVKLINSENVKLVLNCCTAGLYINISNLLDDQQILYYELNHPSSWWRGKIFKDG